MLENYDYMVKLSLNAGYVRYDQHCLRWGLSSTNDKNDGSRWASVNPPQKWIDVLRFTRGFGACRGERINSPFVYPFPGELSIFHATVNGMSHSHHLGPKETNCSPNPTFRYNKSTLIIMSPKSSYKYLL